MHQPGAALKEGGLDLRAGARGLRAVGRDTEPGRGPETPWSWAFPERAEHQLQEDDPSTPHRSILANHDSRLSCLGRGLWSPNTRVQMPPGWPHEPHWAPQLPRPRGGQAPPHSASPLPGPRPLPASPGGPAPGHTHPPPSWSIFPGSCHRSCVHRLQSVFNVCSPKMTDHITQISRSEWLMGYANTRPGQPLGVCSGF